MAMNQTSSFANILIFLAAAVICVPLSKRLGLGSVLGYLIAGILIGPFGFHFIANVEDVMHFSEFGVVLLLFIIGLELDPKKLWSLRIPIFGMGGIQVVGLTLIMCGVLFLFKFSFAISLLIGMGFSLSSTAIALQFLNEKKLMGTTAGKDNFSILLFQDIAVIPMIAILPLLAVKSENAVEQSMSLLGFLKTAGIIVLVVIVGRHLLRPVLRFIAGLHLREIFTAFALLLVMSMAFLMQTLEISMALGAFIAGVLLADSEYRHALESDIEPFKGLLLGLFFISVGMSVSVTTVLESPILMISAVLGVLLIKFIFHYALGLIFKIPRVQIPFFSLVIAQVGEFAFVLFGAGLSLNVLDEKQAHFLTAVVALSMLATPLFIWVYSKFLEPILLAKARPDSDVIENEHNPVIIAGFGRFGQIVGRLLYANKITATVLDYEPDQIELLRKFGFKIYYGDATRRDLLESAGIHQAKILIIAIDDVDDSVKLARLAKDHYPHLKIFSRARNLQHMYSLMDLGIEKIERETFEASLRMGTQVLQSLGWAPYDSVKAAHIFREHNLAVIEELHKKRDDEKEMLASAKQARTDLEKMFVEDQEIRSQNIEGWD